MATLATVKDLDPFEDPISRVIRVPKNLLYFFIRHPQFLHQADDSWAIYKRSPCAVERRRSQLLALLCEGESYAEVLAITRYSYQGADKIVDAYVAQGLNGLKDQRHGNRGVVCPPKSGRS